MRATERTSPFFSAEARIREAGVGLVKRMRARARARRVVAGLWVCGLGGVVVGEAAGGVGGGRETMCAEPVEVRWVRWVDLAGGGGGGRVVVV